MNHSINIVKYSGDVVPFDMNKLINSLRHAKASEELIQQIVEQVEDQIYDGITTKKIYQMAFNMLKGKSRVSASKYKLKKAGMRPPICVGIHSVFSGNAYQDLLDSGVEKIITCHTIPHPSNGIDLSDILAKEVKKLMHHT